MTSCQWRAAVEYNSDVIYQNALENSRSHIEVFSCVPYHATSSKKYIDTLLLVTGPIIPNKQQLHDLWSTIADSSDKEQFDWIPEAIYLTSLLQKDVKSPDQCLFVTSNGQRCAKQPSRNVIHDRALCKLHQGKIKTLDVGIQIKWA